jgi:hypothetical protein
MFEWTASQISVLSWVQFLRQRELWQPDQTRGHGDLAKSGHRCDSGNIPGPGDGSEWYFPVSEWRKSNLGRQLQKMIAEFQCRYRALLRRRQSCWYLAWEVRIPSMSWQTMTRRGETRRGLFEDEQPYSIVFSLNSRDRREREISTYVRSQSSQDGAAKADIL